MKTGKQKAQERYERWWVGKYCRVAWFEGVSFKQIKAVNLYGPPSFVYGQVHVVFEDDTEMLVPTKGNNSYIPTKDVMIALTPEEYEAQIKIESGGLHDLGNSV